MLVLAGPIETVIASGDGRVGYFDAGGLGNVDAVGVGAVLGCSDVEGLQCQVLALFYEYVEELAVQKC